MTARVDGSERREERPVSRNSPALWFGLMGGPLAALGSIMITYPAVDRACVSDSAVLLHALTILFLAIAVISGLIAWRLRERVGAWPTTAAGPLPRTQFLAMVGMMTASLGVVGIIMQWIPIFFLRACQGT
jgi:hypothetical protein